MSENPFLELIFITNVVLPVFLLVFVGILLRVINVINDNFVKVSSDFVFKVSLPALIFFKLYDVDLERTFDIKMILIIIIGTVATYYIAKFVAYRMKLKSEDEGVFIQGAFRGNYAIVGLAIILRMFGPDAVAKASFYLLFALPLYNFLGVWVLTLAQNKNTKIDFRKIAKDILLNPLVLSVIVAIPFSLVKFRFPDSIETTGSYLAAIALPLALLGIGGSINIKSIKEASGLAFGSVLIKNIISPIIVLVAAYFLGIRGVDLGLIFVIFACPTAIASFIMAAAMKGNIRLAGNIVVISTLSSLVTLTLGLFILKALELM
jgi:malonate transporter and related proteins